MVIIKNCVLTKAKQMFGENIKLVDELNNFGLYTYMRDEITINQLCNCCVIWKANDETWKIPIFFIDNETKQSKADGEMINEIQKIQLPTSTAGIHNLKEGKTYGIGLHNSYNKLDGGLESYDMEI
eukprot:g12384.t1